MQATENVSVNVYELLIILHTSIFQCLDIAQLSIQAPTLCNILECTVGLQ
jgi:hypothetical protein